MDFRTAYAHLRLFIRCIIKPPTWFLIALCLFSFFAFIGINGTYGEHLDAVNWKETSAEITKLNVDEFKETVDVTLKDKTGKAGNVTKKTYTNYDITLDYKYTVNEELYTSSAISLTHNSIVFSKEQKAQDFATKYAIGTQHTILYNPKNVSRAVLVEKDYEVYYNVLVGIIIFAIFVWLRLAFRIILNVVMFVIAFKQRKNSNVR